MGSLKYFLMRVKSVFKNPGRENQMRFLKNTLLAFFLVMVSSGLIIYPAQAKKPFKWEGEFVKEIVLFQEHATWTEIRDVGKIWKKDFDIKTVMKLPFINALVMRVPDDAVILGDVADHPLVESVEGDGKIFEIEGLSNNGKSFIEKIPSPKRMRGPWSLLRLLDQPYDDDSLIGPIDPNLITDEISFVFERLKENKVRIAIFDTGIFNEHVKIKDSLNEGIDIIDRLAGRFGEETPLMGPTIDDNGHGTHVTGIITTFLDPEYKWGREAKDYVEIYPVKILDKYATGDVSNIIMGLQWAIDNDIDIINMSVGYRQDTPALRRAFQEAYKANLTIVASVGNHSNWDDEDGLQGLADGGSADGGSADGGSADGGSADGGSADGGSADGGSADGGSADGGSADGGSADGGSADGGSADGGSADGGSADGGSADGGSADGGSADGGSAGSGSGESLPRYSVMYPARYSEVIAVGASGKFGELASFSNSGEEMDIMAPGVKIPSADITNGNKKKGFGLCSGTSMAAPYVTAVAAMIKGIAPMLDNDAIKDILIRNANYDAQEPAGELNLTGAINETLAWLLNQDPDTLSRNEMKEIYRQNLIEKMETSGEILWQ
ncbi:S8 family serine peptidase [Desulfonema magnum]|uniref:Peptidase S8/S53 domain-containing protein n=1 Tax=Desulfonema magnum TaxID=45655 RepID=A0A975BF59_9BACT|nr:S8 family serine peptidase [Desulfonema magnum]QTA84287.1 Peptidase S8/S53 domain-containing protein [Desulfonema magnum]